MGKFLAVLGMTFLGLAVQAATLQRSEWLAKVGDCAQDAALLKATIGQIAASEQASFLAEVNEAISKMPGSDDVRAAAYLTANRAALVASAKGNRTALLAEVFATVPPEVLTVVNENFARDLFNRNVNPAHPFSDEDYTALAVNAMKAIVERCATAENGAVRATFAVLMFERAAGSVPKGLREQLVATLPAGSRSAASGEWIPAAMGEGREKSYDPMLGVSEAGEEPDHAVVLQMTAMQTTQALLLDLQTAGSSNVAARSALFVPPGIAGAVPNGEQADYGINRIPRTYVASVNSPAGLTAVIDPVTGKIMTDEQGREIYRDSTGEIVYKTVDENGRTIYVDEDGNVVTNPYYKGKHESSDQTKEKEKEPDDYGR